MLAEESRYNFPENNPGPFELDFDGNYFILASKYSNLSRDLDSFTFNAFVENIPMGYKTIIVCHRCICIENGEIKKEWIIAKNTKLTQNTIAKGFLLTSDKHYIQYFKDWNRSVESLNLFRPEATDGSLDSCIWTDIDMCKKYAVSKSLETGSKMLISVVIDTISWH